VKVKSRNSILASLPSFAYLLVSSLLVSMSFEPIGLWYLSPLGYALYLHLALRHKKAISHSIAIAFVFAFISNLLILSWSKTFVGVYPWILLTLLQALLFLPVGITAYWKSNVPLLIFVILLMEEIKARFPFGGFSWTRIAFSQIDSPLAPIISITGAVGLSLSTLLISITVLHKRRSYIVTLLALLFISSTVISAPSQVKDLAILGVQGGAGERGLDFNSRAEQVLDRHISQTRDDFVGEELIVWPENAIDIDPFQSTSVATKIRGLLTDVNTPLLAGAIMRDGKLRNASILFSPDGEAQSIYLKRYLTPFGEYIPLRTIAEKLSPLVNQVSDFSPGNLPVIHYVKSVPVASIICYEILNDKIMRQAASESELLIVQTNNATFSGSAQGMQQLAISSLRAIEMGRSVLSVSTTGPSALIDKSGEVLQFIEDGNVGSLATKPSLESGRTLSVKFGGLMTVTILITVLIWTIIDFRRRERLR